MPSPHLRRHIFARIAGNTYRIPELWMVARSAIHEKDGLDPVSAYRAALDDWHEQAELERLYNGEKEAAE